MEGGEEEIEEGGQQGPGNINDKMLFSKLLLV